MKKVTGRKRRHKIIRKRISGNASRPRICVSRSNKNFNAQLIDDIKHLTLFSLSTDSKDIKKKLPYGGNVKAAILLGEEFAKKAKEKGFDKVVFDRAGYLYHGRIKAFAEAARKSGLSF
ncbi:MAG: 50S ribosomal protein L18 [Candidatus Omnitrophota bacterium]